MSTTPKLSQAVADVMAFDEAAAHAENTVTWGGIKWMQDWSRDHIRGRQKENERTRAIVEKLCACVAFVEYCAKQDTTPMPDHQWLIDWRNDKKIESQRVLADLRTEVEKTKEGK